MHSLEARARMLARWRAVMALVVLGLLLLLAAPAAAQDAGLNISDEGKYVVDVETGVIHVERVFVFSHSGSSGFYESISVPVDASAENVFVEVNNQDLSRGLVKRGGDWVVDVPIGIGPDARKTVVLTYDIVGNPNRSQEGPARVNPALTAWQITVIGDPGKSSVKVTVPKPYRPEWAGSNVGIKDRNDAYQLEVVRINNPDDFILAIAARDDRRLAVREFNVDGNFVRLHYWPGDEEWADFVEDNAKLALPILKDRIGRPWPEIDTLDVIESPRPYLMGYGGWYAINLGEIEVGELLLTNTLIHEFTHAWFNDTLFPERFITEGLADTFARQAALTLLETDLPEDVRRAMEETLEEPEEPDLNSLAARALLDWSSSSFGSFETEYYGYSTSFYVVNEIYNEIGAEAFAEVLVAADLDYTAYPGSDATEKVFVAENWQRFFDLVTRIGGSQQADELFRTYVLNGDLAQLLDEREAAIVEYEAFVAGAQPYAAPITVRDAMGAWAFDAAIERMRESEAAIADLQALDARAAESNFILPVDLTPDFEAGDFDEIAPTLAIYTEALDRVEEVEPMRNRTLSWLEELGLGETDTDHFFDLAAARLAAGNPEGAIEAADQAVSQFGGLRNAGIRLLAIWIVAGVVGLMVLGVALKQLITSRRKSSLATRLEALGGTEEQDLDDRVA